MYVDEIILRDFRAIGLSRVSLTHPLAADAHRLEASNLNVVVGWNGSGKSSVLKAVAATIVVDRGLELPSSAAGWPRIGGTGDAEVQLRWSQPANQGSRLGQVGPRISRDGQATTSPTDAGLHSPR